LGGVRVQGVKICVVTPSYMLSGVALAQHRFARALAAAGHDVDLVVGRIDAGLTVPASPGVRVVELGLPHARQMVRPLWRYLRQDKPDVVFSAEDHLNTLVTLTAWAAGSRAKISGSSRVTPFDTYSNKPFTKRWLLKHLSRLSFRRADVLTCVSKDMVNQYRETFGALAPHVAIYNIVDDAASRQRMLEPVSEAWLAAKTLPVVIAAGMLAEWKGFADLIAAFAEVRTPARLIILGEGPLRSELEAQIATLGIGDRVKLTGHTTNALAHFARSDVFVLSSRVEGLPNVLVEAMMCGCTPVSTDCPTGPREVLDGGRYGALVPVGDRPALARAIDHALAKPTSPELLAEAIRPFEEATVIAHHFRALGLA
jgi:glycosyltransferase involved in cell wall biosynthesis